MSAEAYVGPPAVDLSGSTVVTVQAGDRILFCLHESTWSIQEMGEFAKQLKAVLPGVEVAVVGGVQAVVHQPMPTLMTADEYAAARAAEAAACTCPGCMTGKRCVEDQPEDGGDEHALCSFCPDDCAICLDTQNCDCPTHGGE